MTPEMIYTSLVVLAVLAALASNRVPAEVTMMAALVAVLVGDVITVEQALSHPYMASLHDPSDEPCCPSPFHFPLDDGHLNGFHIRDLIFDDIVQHHLLHRGNTIR